MEFDATDATDAAGTTAAARGPGTGPTGRITAGPGDDLAGLVPDLAAHLRPGVRVVAVERFTPRRPGRPASALATVLRLTGAARPREIGTTGPARAATATGDGVGPELRLYEAVFGRDALRTAAFLADRHPALRRATVLRLAAAQGLAFDSAREEEPGRIAHELRDPDDPVATRLTAVRGWGWPYYGTVDATPLWMLAAAAWIHHGPAVPSVDLGDPRVPGRTMGDAWEAALGWLLRKQDADPDGFVTYRRVNPGGLENQVWRDSWDGYVHADGEIARWHEPVAALEVQAVAHDALLAAAEVERGTFGNFVRATELVERAARLRERVHACFWVDDTRPFYALGLDYGPDGARRHVAAVTGDMAQLLDSRLLDGDDPGTAHRREAVVRRLLDPALLAPAGLRTLAEGSARYHPGGYHTGSTWPWQTMLAAEALERHGHPHLAEELRARVRNLCAVTNLLPEFARGEGDGPPRLTDRIVDAVEGLVTLRLEQPPQELQAWTAAAVLADRYRRWARRTGREPDPLAVPPTPLERELLAGLPNRAA